MTVSNIPYSSCSYAEAAALSTLERSVLMAMPMSSAPYTALPATMTLAPAAAAWSIVEGDRPPSTWCTRQHQM